MLVMKYEKLGPSVFFSHLDTMRHITRAIRRAGIEVAYSEGFHPHMQLNLSTPLPLGIASCAEYCTVAADISPEKFLKDYNSCAAPGLAAIQAVNVLKNPNLAGLSDRAEYLIRLPGLESFSWDVLGILEESEFNIEYCGKEGQTVKNVRDMILALNFMEDGLHAVLAAGNANLRPDRFSNQLAALFRLDAASTEIVKLRHFIRTDHGVKDIDEIL